MTGVDDTLPAAERAARLAQAGAQAFTQRAFADAARCFAEALALTPGERSTRFNLGLTFEALAQYEDALAAYEAILARGADVEAWVRIGIVRYLQASGSEACAAFAQALRLEPAHPLASLNFGIIATQLGALDDAVRVLRAATAAHPREAKLQAALAEALRVRGDADGAARAAAVTLALDPANVEALLVTGHTAYAAGEFARAEVAFARAQRADPGRYEPPMNLGVLYHGLGRVAPALACARRAVTLAPGDPSAHFNLGTTHLLAGELAAGFAEVEWRHRRPAQAAWLERFVAAAVPMWNGASLDGGTLLVASDQGLGDFVLWSRLFGAARARGARIAVECPPALAALYRENPFIDELISGTCAVERLREFAAFVPVCSLPYVLGLAAPCAPDASGVVADPQRVAWYRALFAASGKRRTVGLVWAGEPSHPLDRFRSCPLAEFAALADVPGIAWVRLQKGARANDPAPVGLDLIPLAQQLHDFGETAAAIGALDLVIAVDTSVAHVAGALGAPVWTLHGFGHAWPWGVDRSDTPWYPSMRLFRQHVPARWDGLFADVRAALEAWETDRDSASIPAQRS